MRIALYARVSTTDQNCEMQLRELREYTARRGWEIAGEYVDTGWSGTKASRPQLDRLMKDASVHQFDCILVWKIDRFGRSVSNLADALERLRLAGVRFISVTQNLDTDETNPMARFMLHILAAVAEFEREMIRERVKAGMNNAKRQGKSLGRHKVVFDRQKALDMGEAGVSIRVIASKLGVGRGTVQRLLAAA